jgi:hypothetical protein
MLELIQFNLSTVLLYKLKKAQFYFFGNNGNDSSDGLFGVEKHIFFYTFLAKK